MFNKVKDKLLARVEEVVKGAMDPICKRERFRERKKSYRRFLNSGLYDEGSEERKTMEGLEDKLAGNIAWRGMW